MASQLPPPGPRIPPPYLGPERLAPPPPPPKRRRGATAALVALVCGLIGGTGGVLVGVWLADTDRDPQAQAPSASQPLTTAPPRDPIIVPDTGRLDVPAVVDVLRDSVVTISVDIAGARGGTGTGTGVIITTDGEILTNAHVIEGATSVRVRLPGETEPRSADVLASDPGNDLALLRIDATGLQPATFADPDSVQVGDEVVAMGFALGLDGGPSVTSGIVSALDRTIITSLGALDGLIQTDAAISSGNSGGPLANARGEVVGINTAVARGDSSTAANNISFAIGVGEVLRVLDQLRMAADGQPRVEAYLGVGLGDRNDGGQGAVITEIQAGSPAADAGLRAGDIVVSIDGAPIDGSAGLIAAIRDRMPGETVALDVIREGQPTSLSATLVERPG